MVEENDPIVSFSASEGGVLNTSVYNVEMRFSDLVALLNDEEEKVASKDGPYIVPSAMRNDKRHGNNAYDAGLLGFDIEDHPLDLDELRAFMPHRAVVYSTHSHGVRFDSDGDPKWLPGYPRIRLLLPLARPVSAKEYKVLHAWGISRLDGLQSPDKALAHPDSIADPAAKDPSRAFYMPRKRAEDAERDPFFLDWSGDVLDPDNLPDGQSVADLLEKSEKAKPKSKRKKKKKGSAKDIECERMREALTFVDPDQHRNIWRDIGIALKTEFGEEGWSIWSAWSKRGEYPGDKEARYQWDSFNDEELPPGEGVTLGTVYHLAYEGGWTGKMRIEDALDILDECRDLDDYYTAKTLRAAARLKEDNGVPWGQVVADVKTKARILPGLIFSNWQKKVGEYEKEIQAARRVAAAQIRLEEREANPEVVITNFERRITEDGEEIRYRKTVPEIVADIQECTGGWPRMMDNVPFMVDVEQREPVYFERPHELFAWLSVDGATVEWTGRDLCVDTGGVVRPESREDAFCGVAMSTPPEHHYKTIETIPHVPRVPEAYYIERELPEATGEILSRFLDLFAAATPHDRNLIEALILTGMVGLSPGKRPAFVITSDHGVGAGKSSTANAICKVYGGKIGIRASDGFGKLEQRLLDPSTTSKRFCMIDNLRDRLASAEFESAITEHVISGKRMYVGNGERINYLTWIFTANTPTLSNDLSSRSVVIKIGEADQSVNFEAEVDDILENHGDQLIADIKARLEEPDSGRVEIHHDRWQAWQSAVLSRFENADELAELIQTRRGEVDDDAAIAEQWAGHIRELLIKKHFEPDEVRVVIPSQELLALTRKVEADNTIGFRDMWPLINDAIGVGEMKNAKKHRTNDLRGLLWVGKNTTGTLLTDFHENEQKNNSPTPENRGYIK